MDANGFIPQVPTGQNVTAIKPGTWNKIATGINAGRIDQRQPGQFSQPTPNVNWVWARGIDIALPRYTPLAIIGPIVGSDATAANPEHAEVVIGVTLTPNSVQTGNICVSIDPIPAATFDRVFRVAVSGLTYVRARRGSLGNDPYRLNSRSLSTAFRALNAANDGDLPASWIEDPFVPVDTPYLALINLDRNAQTVVTGQITALFHSPAGGIPGATFDGTNWTWGSADCQTINAATGALSGSTTSVLNAGGPIAAARAVTGHFFNGVGFVVNRGDGGGPVADPSGGDGLPGEFL